MCGGKGQTVTRLQTAMLTNIYLTPFYPLLLKIPYLLCHKYSQHQDTVQTSKLLQELQSREIIHVYSLSHSFTSSELPKQDSNLAPLLLSQTKPLSFHRVHYNSLLTGLLLCTEPIFPQYSQSILFFSQSILF